MIRPPLKKEDGLPQRAKEFRERKTIKKKLEAYNKGIQKAKEIAEGNFDFQEYCPYGPKEVEIGKEELRALPSKDIAAELAMAAKKIGQVAISSGNLKDGFIKILKALKVRMGSDALATRALGALPAREREIEEELRCLREEVRSLKEANTRLRGDRSLMPPPLTLSTGIRDTPLPPDRMVIEGEEPPLPRSSSPREKNGHPREMKDTERQRGRGHADSDTTLRKDYPPKEKIHGGNNRRTDGWIGTLYVRRWKESSPSLRGNSFPPSRGTQDPDRARQNAPAPPKKGKAVERPVPTGDRKKSGSGARK